MNNGKRVFIGYHGTTEDGKNSILSSKKFNMSRGEEEWLGTGIYFFEDDIDQAKDWCKNKRHYRQWSIIKSKLETNNFINLINKKELKRFNESVDKLKNRYIKNKHGRIRKVINAVVLNAMYITSPYDLVRAVFGDNSLKPNERVNILSVQVQICVRNENCIKSMKEVK